MAEEKEIPKEETEQSLIDKASLAAERLEKASALMKAENDRAEKLASRAMLAGKAPAAVPQVIDPEAEKKAKLREYWKGTVIEKMIK